MENETNPGSGMLNAVNAVKAQASPATGVVTPGQQLMKLWTAIKTPSGTIPTNALSRINGWILRKHGIANIVIAAHDTSEGALEKQRNIVETVQIAINTGDWSAFDDPAAAGNPEKLEGQANAIPPAVAPYRRDLEDRVIGLNKALGHSDAMIAKGYARAIGRSGPTAAATIDELTDSQLEQHAKFLNGLLEAKENVAKSDAKAPTVAKEEPKKAESNVVDFPTQKENPVRVARNADGTFVIPTDKADLFGSLAYQILNRLVQDGALEVVISECAKKLRPEVAPAAISDEAMDAITSRATMNSLVKISTLIGESIRNNGKAR